MTSKKEREIQSGMQQHLSLGNAPRSNPVSANGLTDEATKSLSLARAALKEQMLRDFDAGTLDQDRMEMLIGRGPVAYAVATAILQPFIMSFPDR